jgi:hypothetical protein
MFLAFFIPELLGGLALAMGTLVGRAIIALGIGFVTYKGTMLVVTSMETLVMNSVGGLAGDAVGLFGYLWLDKAITIMFSSVAVSMAIRGIGGSVKRMVLK